MPLVSADRESAAIEGRLDLHEGISHPDPATGGCPRWPEQLRLLNRSTGELVRGRCRATNQCGYCARLAAVENAELLALDAVEHAPTVWAVLTTRTADVDVKRFWRARERAWRAVRRRWPHAEYAFLVEFATGYGPRSGGLRRPHWNLLVKGVPAAAVEELRQVLVDAWCRQVDAQPWAQHVGLVENAGGLMRYIALHFLKESQAPPVGWRGHRFRCSRGYLVRPAVQLRAEARRSLRLKRLIWRGLEAEFAELELRVLEAQEWALLYVNPSTTGRGSQPAASPVRARAQVDRGAPAGAAGGTEDAPPSAGWLRPPAPVGSRAP